MLTEFKVGLLAIGAMIAVGYMSFVITSKQSGFGRYKAYRTIIRDASGIFPKTPIKVAGITAGRIKKIELLDNNALITFEIIDRIKLTKGSKLKVKAVGFLGDRFLQIILNNDSEEEMPEMAFISSLEGGGMENIMRDATDIMADLKDIISGFKDSLTPVGEDSPLKKIASNLSNTTKDLSLLVKSLSNVVTGNEGKFNRIITNLDEFTEQMNAELDGGDSTSAMGEFRDTLSNFNSLSRDLKDIMSDLKKGKGTIGKFLVEDQIADDIKTTLASVKKIVGKANTLRTDFQAFTGSNKALGSKTDLNLGIFPSPERFYLLGITVGSYGATTERQTTVLDKTGKIISDTTTRDKNKSALLFNAQFGRILHNWTFRIGIIESTGGAGVDYTFNTLQNKVSLDAYNYKKDLGINLRISDEFRIWNIIYGRLSLENSLKHSSGTVSVGFRFTEEDLKGLLGFFF